MAMPPSSPRLPSPPPPAEVQFGPQSPSSLNPTATRAAQQMEQTAFTAAAKRRIRPGTKAADMAAGPPLIPLNELDSAFQLQEHLSALHYYHTQSNTVPITREAARKLATPPDGIDRTLWLYELCRFLIAQCNSLIVGFLFDEPPCSAATCPEMRASEWQFLCAVHDAPKSCCAIDYCCHTLDWAANVVTNPKIFPSRFVAPVSDSHDKGAALKNLVNVFRRLHRIFAHAWFQHRGVFWSVEGQTGLYVFFKTVCDTYDLLPAENYKLPPEAEGLEMATSTTDGKTQQQPQQQQQQQPAITIASRPLSAVQQEGGNDDNFASQAARTNTRRHIRSNPSTGNAISMVPEVDEDDHHAGGAARMHFRNISSKPTVPPAVPELPNHKSQPTLSEDSEPEAAEVPVIVMQEATPILPTRRETATRVTTTETSGSDDENLPDAPPVAPEQQPDLEEAVEKEDPVAAAAVVSGLQHPAEPATADPPPQPLPIDAKQQNELDEQVADEAKIISQTEEEPSSTLPHMRANDISVSVASGQAKADLEEAVQKDDPVAAAAVVAAETQDEGGDEAKDTKKAEEAKHQAEQKDDAAAAAAVAEAVPEVVAGEEEVPKKEDDDEGSKKNDDEAGKEDKKTENETTN